MTGPRLPDLFIIGAPRCGTTALYTYLRHHPHVFMTPVKELHFFCPDLFLPPPPPVVRDETAYRSMFREAAGQRRVGEASPFYLYSQRAPEAIKAFNPNARIIIMLRNPPEMMYSMYCLRRNASVFHASQETIPTFEQALAAEPERLRGENLPDGAPREPGRCVYLCYRELARYAPRVEQYFQVFGRAAVHVIIFDDLVAAPGTVYREACRFLDLDPAFAPDFILTPERRAANVGLRSRLLARLLWTRESLPGRSARAVLPTRARRSLPSLLHRWNTTSPPVLDPAVRRRLAQESAADIRRLSELIDRDLGVWLRG